MNKKLIMSITLFWVTVVMTSGFTACSGNSSENSEKPLDPTKTQLYVANFDGGFGCEWLNKAAKRFEELHEETVFVEGTKGVQIYADEVKVSGETLISSLATQPQDIFFTEQAFYYDAVNSGKLLEITDIVTEDLSKKYGEEGSIFDKLSETQKKFLQTSEGKVYALPHYASYFGITYDIDLFENNNLYYAKNPTTANGLVTNPEQTRSVGPDGKEGTEDDGLPATYDEFFALCDCMIKKNIIPFVWSGMVRGGYINSLLSALLADCEGAENMMKYYELDGVCSDAVSDITVDETGKITDISFENAFELNETNGYKLYQQAGRAYALSFLKRMLSNPTYYHADAKDESVSHLEAQLSYLESSFINKPIAFLIDGIFWENEAETAGSFDQIVGMYGEDGARENRRFGFLPLPKISESADKGASLLDYIYSMAFITSSIDTKKIELAKAFLQFCYTDESLKEFTLTTNAPKSLNYSLGEEEYDKLSSFGRSVMKLKNSKNTEVIYPYSTNTLFLNHQTEFNIIWKWASIVNGTSKTYPIDAFRKESIGLTEYFKGMANMYNQTSWDNVFARYYD